MLRGKNNVLLVIFLFGIFCLSGCSMFQKEEKMPPAEVKAITLEKTTTPLTVDFIGQVQAMRVVEIRPQVSGFIIEKCVSGGQQVKKGQLLYRINPQPYELGVLNAKARVVDSEAALAGAKRDFERAKKLYNSNATSLENYQNAETQLERLTAGVEIAKSELGIKEIDLGFTNIVAPIDGHLSTTMLDLGSYVTQGQSVLTTLSSENPVLVSFSLSEGEYLYFMNSDLKGRSENNKVSLVLENGNVYGEQGVVTQVESGLTQGTGSLTLKAEFKNADGLLMPGMFAKVRIVVRVQEDAILVPQRAVTDLMGKKMVTVLVDGNRVEERQVEISTKFENMYLIKSGLQVGDVVIVEGGQKAAQSKDLKVEMLKLDDFKTQAVKPGGVK